MQNKHVGDIGDFGKYALLRTLFQTSSYKLGINWYLAETENTKNNDSRYTEYLNLDPMNPKPKLEKEYRPCDKELYRTLQHMVAGGNRSVTEIENSKILGENTIFYTDLLGNTDRETWHKNGLKFLKKADFVFFDPDHGLEIESCPKNHKNHVKYIFFDELADYFKRGQSLIVYSHRDRKPEKEYIKRFLKIKRYIKKEIGLIGLLRFNHYSVRDYLFVLQPEHTEYIQHIIDHKMDQEEVGKLFHLIDMQ